MDLESKLLLVAIGTCIWGAVQIMHPELMPNLVSAVTVVMLGEAFALWCSDDGPHAVARLAVLSVCFGTQSVAFLSRAGHFMLSAFCAVVAVYCAWRAFEKFRKSSRERMSSIVQPRTDSVLQAAWDVTSPFKLPMVPVRDMVIVPGTTVPLVVGREFSVRALEYAIANDQKIFFATQHDASNEEPKIKEISQFGCVCKVLQHIKMPNGHFKVLVEGTEMAKTIEVNETSGFFLATLHSVNTNVVVESASAVVVPA